MIVYKWWATTKRNQLYTHKRTWEGWFLFGFVPLFVKQVKEETY